ncbi:MAG: saccharopine dehydrogenase C-terminal domain-containing protein [Arenicellales bacterium]
MKFNKIAVLGLGKVGTLAAELLHVAGFDVTGFDRQLPAGSLPFQCKQSEFLSMEESIIQLEGFEAVLSCLPYHLNTGVATAAHSLGIHYFDLTEDVPTTQAIRILSETSQGIMAPQCGLAPGLIGIIGAHLVGMFDQVRNIRLRVGALPQNPTGLLGYAFNWSPEGVVNEYLNDCEVIEEGKRKTVSAMEWIETIYVEGVKLEAFTTSGGLGTMCETYLGEIDNIDYKTMRYPGHVQQMNFFFHELLMREDRKMAGKILTHAKPPVEDDVIYIHASVEGEIDGHLKRKEFVRAYKPILAAGKMRCAIAWTTTASACSVIEMVRSGTLPSQGFLKQESISFQQLLETESGKLFNESL